MDRVNLHIQAPAVPHMELRGKDEGVTSVEMRVRVAAARAVESARGFCNAHIPANRIRALCALDGVAERTL